MTPRQRKKIDQLKRELKEIDVLATKCYGFNKNEERLNTRYFTTKTKKQLTD